MSLSHALRVVIAPDSFKESLGSIEVAQALARGVLQAAPQAQIHCIPMADGGEGTIDAVLAATAGQRRELTVRGAMGWPVKANWAWLADGAGLIEVASVVGLASVSPGDRAAMQASSYGVGELIKAALDAGATRIVLALGGSATNDGGAGMLQALGVGLYDAAGKALPPGGEALALLARLDVSGLDPRIAATPIQAMVDVNNPLCGPSGASYIFGPQKGATKTQVQTLDAALGRFADVCASVLGQDDRDVPGVGAAGGLGFAAKVFLKADLRPGFELVAELAGLHTAIAQAQLVFTGEGRLDAQTAFGKTPAGVVRLAHGAGVPVVAVAGALEPGYESLYDCGLSAAFSLASGPMTLQQAYERTAELLAQCARDVTRLKFPS